jgi:hypothetical protein
MEIELEDDTKKEDRQDMPIYVTAIFIAFSGIGFLLFTVYYIAFLPIPTPMQPLKLRVLTFLQLEQVREGGFEVIKVVNVNDQERVGIRTKPDKERPIIFEISGGEFYKKIEEEGDWVRLEDQNGGIKGWIEKKYIEVVENENT